MACNNWPLADETNAQLSLAREHDFDERAFLYIMPGKSPGQIKGDVQRCALAPSSRGSDRPNIRLQLVRRSVRVVDAKTDDLRGRDADDRRIEVACFAGVGLLAYIIRVFGGYPDGVAFAVLLMNLCAPLIDLLTQPRIFGMKDKA